MKEHWPEPTGSAPSLDELMEALSDFGTCEATDGCNVEPDGICEHGHPSWLLYKGMI